MSGINGDKSRHQINRKRGVHRRAKIRKLLADAKSRSTATPAPPASGASRPAGGRSR
jgi:hypothetical protein